MSSEPTAGDARTTEDAPRDEKGDDNTTLADLTAFQRDTLWMLAKKGASKGLAIKHDLERYYDEPVNHGRLYPNLDELTDLGLVDKGTRDARTNEYTLTEAGADALAERRAWTDTEVVGA
ncbi:MAG: helix-turn-helix transcriptional regulator [Halorientalis sp.]